MGYFGQNGREKGGKEIEGDARVLLVRTENKYLMVISLYRPQIDGSRRCCFFLPLTFVEILGGIFQQSLSPRATWQLQFNQYSKLDALRYLTG
jgi:hypothetical protein